MLHARRPPPPCGRTARHPRARPLVAAAPTAVASPLAEDPWIEGTLAAADAGTPPAPPPALAPLRASCRAALATARMPTTRQEEYRFTDVAPLLASPLPPPAPHAAAAVAALAASHALEGAAAVLVFVDGVLAPELCDTGRLPAGAFAGSVADAPAPAAATLGAASAARGGAFATLNGALTRGAVAITVDAGVSVEGPIHALYIASAAASATPSLAAPRLVLHAAAGSSLTLVEEFAGEGAGPAAATQVTEAVVAPDAALTHAFVALLPAGASLVKATLVDQGERSSYALSEARTGGSIVRHDVSVAQLGAATHTRMRHFLLAAAHQLHDLHTSLDLAHPDGDADQLHKCIAAAPTSRCVFDGGVLVRRAAQRTDAGQLSRNLLLARRATVNVKPNLQIVADDVKCTHGCAVSDLEEEALFYFRARGVDAATARRVLVDSFGAEVTAGLPAGVRARVAAASAAALAGVVEE